MRVSFFRALTISRNGLASPASILVVMKCFVDRGMRAFHFLPDIEEGSACGDNTINRLFTVR